MTPRFDLRRYRPDPAVLLVLLAVSIGIGFRRLLGAGFFHDDWTYLARAVGFLSASDLPVRPLSFDLYWRVLYTVFGSESLPYTISRLVLHLGAGIVLARVVGRLGADVPTSWFAAALYLLSPLAFEGLYWASGVSDLLANLGLLLAVLGLLRGDRLGAGWFLLGGLINLASKETGWWLPIAGVVAWRRRGRREFAVVATILALVAVTALVNTARGLGHDYSWSPGAVPWNLARAGSWLLPRPDDLIHVWEADRMSLAVGVAVWVGWGVWAAYRWRRGDRLSAAGLACGLLALAPAAGLAGHMVPRYLLPVLALLAATIAVALPRGRSASPIVMPLVAVAATVFCSWFVDQILDRTYPNGRPSHRMVTKELMVRQVWDYLDASGVEQGTGIVFLRRAEDDVGQREYLLDCIGRTWGPHVVLASPAPVLIVDDIAKIPLGVPVFQFGHWSIEYLGALR